jgi:hypothetical protein
LWAIFVFSMVIISRTFPKGMVKGYYGWRSGGRLDCASPENGNCSQRLPADLAPGALVRFFRATACWREKPEAQEWL